VNDLMSSRFGEILKFSIFFSGYMTIRGFLI